MRAVFRIAPARDWPTMVISYQKRAMRVLWMAMARERRVFCLLWLVMFHARRAMYCRRRVMCRRNRVIGIGMRAFVALRLAMSAGRRLLRRVWHKLFRYFFRCGYVAEIAVLCGTLPPN